MDKKINDLRNRYYSILDEALHIIGEYQQWLDFHAKEEKTHEKTMFYLTARLALSILHLI